MPNLFSKHFLSDTRSGAHPSAKALHAHNAWVSIVQDADAHGTLLLEGTDGDADGDDDNDDDDDEETCTELIFLSSFFLSSFTAVLVDADDVDSDSDEDVGGLKLCHSLPFSLISEIAA